MIDACRGTIQQSLKTCVESSRHDWVAKTPGQAVLCAAQVQWAAGITHAIIKGPKALKQYYKDLCVCDILPYSLKIKKKCFVF
jgi:hypothetical protein